MRPIARWLRVAAVACLAIAVTVVLVPLRARPAAAGAQAWTPSGLYGGTVDSLATSPADPAVVLAGSGGAGVFRSTDGGQSWIRSSDGLPADSMVLALAFSPSAPATVYAGTLSSGLWRSTDAGLHWSPVNTGTDNATFSLVTIDPTSASTVFIGDGGRTWRTSDGGTTWTQLHWPDTTADNVAANAVAIAPSNPRVVYVAGSPFMRTTDGGVTWQAMDQLNGPTSVLVDPHDANALLVGSNDGIYRSVDAGATWHQVEPIPLLGDAVITLSRDPTDAARIWAGGRSFGIVRSDDGGTTWQADDAGLASYAKQYVRSVAVSSAGVLAAVAHFGVARRATGATTWGASTTGITGSQVNAIAVAPSQGSVLYAAAASQGVFASTDSGATWTYKGLAGTTVLDIAVSPVDAATVWAATLSGVQRSDDGGRSWTVQLPDDANASAPDAVAVAPSSPDTVYAAYFGGGVYQSKDGGNSWVKGSFPDSAVGQSLLVDANDPASVWVGTRFQGIAHSSNGGATWAYVTAQPSGSDAVSIARDPHAPNRMFAAVDEVGLYVSTDSGTTWALAPGVTPSASVVVADPSTPGRIYLGSDDASHPGVLVSTDDGSTWQDLSATLAATRTARTLAVQPDGTVYLGTTAFGRDSGGGIYAYTPAGAEPPPPTPTPSPSSAPSSPPSPPRVTITSAPAPFTLAASVAIAYHGGATYDVRYRRATWNSGFGDFVSPAGWQRTAATAVRLSVARGSTYCLSVRARTSGGITGPWSSDRCTVVPLDDRSLVASAHWSRSSASRYYAGTISSTRSRHVTLTRSHVRARLLALVATRCPGCGWVAVYMGGRLLQRINLHAATTHNRSVVPVATFSSPRRGTVVITTLGNRITRIDGLAVGS